MRNPRLGAKGWSKCCLNAASKITFLIIIVKDYQLCEDWRITDTLIKQHSKPLGIKLEYEKNVKIL